MKLSMNQWLMVGVGAVVLYYIYQKMNENKEVVVPAPPIIPEDITQEDLEVGMDKTQGELFEEKFHAVGGEARYRRALRNGTISDGSSRAGGWACYCCNVLTFESPNSCRKRCRKCENVEVNPVWQ
jgi:hypothetical protein